MGIIGKDENEKKSQYNKQNTISVRKRASDEVNKRESGSKSP